VKEGTIPKKSKSQQKKKETTPVQEAHAMEMESL